MKRRIYSSVPDPKESRNGDYMTFTVGRQRFGIHMYNDDPLQPKFQVSEIHPYNDADYAWARCGYLGHAYVQFIKNGKKIDGMQLNGYDESEYESEYDYITDIVNQTCEVLLEINKDVEPRMVHW